MSRSQSSESSNGRTLYVNPVHGIPKRCGKCGDKVVRLMSRSDINPYRRNDEHVFKWIDDALIEEVEEMHHQNEAGEALMKMEFNAKLLEMELKAKNGMKMMMLYNALGLIFMYGVWKWTSN